MYQLRLRITVHIYIHIIWSTSTLSRHKPKAHTATGDLKHEH